MSRASQRNRGGAHWNTDHPSRKHDVVRPDPVLLLDVAAPVPGQPRRRDRRAAARRPA